MDVKSTNDIRAPQSADQSDQQPREPRTGQCPNAVTRFDVFRNTAGELVVPFGVLDDGINRVVNGDAPEQPPRFIDHRQRDQVVTLHEFGGLFFRLFREDGHDVAFGLQFTDARTRAFRRQQEVLEAEPTGEPVFGVHHIDSVDLMQFVGLPADFADGPCHRPFASDLHEFLGHEGSSGAVFVVEQVPDVRGLFLVFQEANDLLGFGLGQFAHHVRRVVRVQVLQNLLCNFFRGHRTEQIRALLFVQFDEYIRLGFVVKEAEQVARVVEIQPVDDLSDIRRV